MKSTNSYHKMTTLWTLIIILKLSTAIGMNVSVHGHGKFRIVNGLPIPIRMAPWQISVQLQGFHKCGGSILTSSAIVTAAHCVSKFTANQLNVRAGSTYWNNGGQVVQVQSITQHPRYIAIYEINDVAVLHLSTPLIFNPNISPIELASETPAEGDLAAVSGWGDMKEGDNIGSPYLQYVNLQMISHQACSTSGYATTDKLITKGMICAFGYEKDSCQGDSGGPLVSNGKLVGIVSWGIGCARKEYPGVYTDVAYYRNWILTEVNRVNENKKQRST